MLMLLLLMMMMLLLSLWRIDDAKSCLSFLLSLTRCRHFKSLGSPLRTVHSYPSVASQVSRCIDMVVTDFILRNVFTVFQNILLRFTTSR